MQTPHITCRPLPSFDASNLEAVRAAFQNAEPCPFQQAWLSEPESDFGPATVRTGRRDETLLIFAELTDVDIFSNAVTLNERLWEVGDSFEIFLRPVDQVAYLEFQAAPNNERLQLCYADPESYALMRKTGSIVHALIPGDAFFSRTWVRPDIQKWFVYAEIPAKSVCLTGGKLAGSEWRFSFSRYDYTRGRSKPVISSTSAHSEPKFHQQQEWGFLKYE